jgi:hypothetical protein
MKRTLLATLMALVATPAFSQAPLTISDVQTDVRQFTPAKGEKVVVRFRVSRAAKVELRWFDPRELLVRRIASNGELAAGEGSLGWDGRDEASRVVPNEAYHFTLVATAADGATQEHDLTDLTGGDNATIANIKLADGRSIKYALTAWSRVNIRIGMRDGGPLLGSLVNWQVRAPGENSEAWNGMDASGVMNIAQSAALELTGMSFPLPQNAVIVGDPKSASGVITSMPWGETRRVRKQTPAKRMYAHSQQSYEERGDFVVDLSGGKAAKGGTPTVIKGLTPVSVGVGERDLLRLSTQRFELVYFIDGQFIGENEIGFLPATWNVDAGRLTPGEHYLTVNVRGYDGTFGMGSRKIRVD